eukprot:GDKI01005250.1.p3 GENE.GDKI01005250.1~~GDKI01005250.1.p3  ORF type:complete len:104 (+),score=23.13 GDKI01005250.1:81-392(+)
MFRSAARRLFGSPVSGTEPEWVEKFIHTSRKGKDSADWAIRMFNKTGIYENVFKSTPRYFAFILGTAVVGGYYWGRVCENYWAKVNKGKLYKDCPYVYPPEDD